MTDELPPSTPAAEPQLRQALNMPLITLYGLGTTIGGGIYVLIGNVAGRAGLYAPVSFLLAALLAMFTALCFAELSSRLPKSAGEAVYVSEALRVRGLAVLVGCLVIANAVITSAVLVNGFVGYFHTVFTVPSWLAVCAITFLLGLIAFWGIGESVSAAALITIVEIGGLVIVITVGWSGFATLPDKAPDLLPPFETAAWAGILGGSFLAYFAFTGFEDMVNVAEEVKDVRRVLPLAIVLTLIVTAVLYIGVSLVTILGIPIGTLAASKAPLTLFYEYKTGRNGHLITLISIFALLNGALIQIILASRVLYGMSDQGWLPQWLGHINARTRTPDIATLAASIAILALALNFAVETLAQMFTFLIMIISVLVNFSLLRLKLRDPAPPGVVTVPIGIPAIGVAVTAVFTVLVFWDLIHPPAS